MEPGSLHRHRARRRQWLLLLFFVSFFWIAPNSLGKESIQENLRALAAESAEKRRIALVWLAKHGNRTAEGPILKALKKDLDGLVRRLAEQALWAIWTRSGDKNVDELMARGISLLANGLPKRAGRIFSRIIRIKPEFAEGYNKRATAYYVGGEFRRSLQDIGKTLRLNPNHFGALSGAGLCLIKLHKPRDALYFLQRALDINPNMEGIRRLVRDIRGTFKEQQI